MFITNQPAMLIKYGSEGYLIISDLHIGITHDMKKKGIVIPSQIRQFVKKIQELKKLTKAENLIINGDIKHKVPGISWQEEIEIPEFLKKVSKLFSRIIIVKGNHDGWIEKLIIKNLKSKVSVKNCFLVGGYYITHGNQKISNVLLESNKIKTIIIGHNQPCVKFHDGVAYYFEPAWVRGYLYNKKLAKTNFTKHKAKHNKTELVIMPAFNPLCGATIVNRDKLIGPIAKRIDVNNAHVYLLDGTDIGKVKDLQIISSLITTD